MKKILHITSIECGGAEAVLMNYYQNIDRSKIQFGFFIKTQGSEFFLKDIEKLGSEIYRYPGLKKFIKSARILKQIIQNKDFNIIEIHTENAHSVIWVVLGKCFGANKIIVHSHNTKTSKLLQHKVFRCFLNLFRIKRFACGQEAGEFMFKKKPFYIVNNAVDLKKFKYDNAQRTKIRKENNIAEDNILLGNVARFTNVKNQIFLIKLIESIKEKSKYKLMLVGEGPTYNKLKQYVNNKKLDEYIIFTGKQKNVEDYMSAFDVFVLPSLYEGFPTVLVEAQASGLPCIVSENITKEVNINGKVYFLSITNNNESWIKQINKVEVTNQRSETKLADKGYDIVKEAKKLQIQYYI